MNLSNGHWLSFPKKGPLQVLFDLFKSYFKATFHGTFLEKYILKLLNTNEIFSCQETQSLGCRVNWKGKVLCQFLTKSHSFWEPGKTHVTKSSIL